MKLFVTFVNSPHKSTSEVKLPSRKLSKKENQLSLTPIDFCNFKAGSFPIYVFKLTSKWNEKEEKINFLLLQGWLCNLERRRKEILLLQVDFAY
jgi:hypothetical protein